MKKLILISVALPIACVVALTARSQTTANPGDITMETWEPKPAVHALDKKYEKESAVILLDKVRMEYADGPKNKVELYRTMHRIIRVNDDKGIESFNRIYLGVSDNSDIIDIKGRTILPNGKVIEIDKQNIKDLKEENGNQYKIFAMEGLEKGCDVEYYYTYKVPASYFGHDIIQGAFPVVDARLEIRGPERLTFQMKGYNCLINTTDTVLHAVRSLTAELGNVQGADEEKYAAYRANLARIEYKLSYNTANNKDVRLFTWNELAKRVYGYYANCSDKEMKRVGDLISANKWDKLGTDREKIVAAENFIKKNFTAREDISDDNAENIEMIVKNRIANYKGIVRLYAAIYKKLDIQYQLVLACDRNDNVVDRAFENWNNADYFLFYFPVLGKYMAPTVITARYPWIDPYWGGGDALFCKGTTIGNFSTAIAEIKPVVLEDCSESYNRIDSKASLNASLDTLMVDMKQSYGGYSGSAYRAEFTFGSADDRKAALKSLVKFGTNSENIVTSEIENSDFESYSDNKPFAVHAVVKANELLEKAGSKLLVKIGDLIGPQAEMYQEKPRQFPIEVGYPHTLERTIEFTIPDGYSVKNPDDLNIHEVYQEDGKTTIGFASSYVVEKNVVKVHVMEEYRRIFYPLSEYEHFKKVINASADFNKIVLVLEKK
jgi:hypothetical protein